MRVLILILLIPLTKENSGPPMLVSVCESINGSLNKVEWPSTASRTLSTPPCVDQKGQPLYRKCTLSKWEEEPQCFYIQPGVLPECPGNFTGIDTFCYILSPKSSYPPKCPFKNTATFNFYKYIITEPVWMPVTRLENNGFFKWDEFTYLYKSEFVDTYNFIDGIKNKNCLVYFNSSYILAVPCSEQYPGICAYWKLDQAENPLCDSACVQSDFPPESLCFCKEVSLIDNLHPKAEFFKIYQNHLFPLLAREPCGIGLERDDNGTFIWSNSKEEISYTYWSSEVVFDTVHINVASTLNGWILTDDQLPCYLYQTELKKVTPSIDLSINLYNMVLTVKISGIKALKTITAESWVYCFTDASSSEAVYRYPGFSIISDFSDSAVFSFDAVKDGPGNHWCESVTFVDETVIISTVEATDLIEATGNDFVVIVVLQYKQTINPLSRDVVTLMQGLCEHFSENEVLHNYTCRFMVVVDLEEETSRVRINFHLTNQIRKTDEPEYRSVETNLEEMLNKNEDVDLVAFLSTTTCFNETENGLSWPTTRAQSSAKSVEFCFNSERALVQRYCTGDFINGVRWLDVDSCEIAEYSEMTLELVKLGSVISTPSVFILSGLDAENITKPLDVYMIGDILLKALNADGYDLNIDMFLSIINNAMNVDRALLRESELKMRGTSQFLQVFEIIINSARYVSTETANFFVSQYNSEICGIAVYTDASSPVALNCDSSTEDIQALESLDGAIFISCAPREKGMLITTTAFLKDVLFNERTVSSKLVSKVFSAELPNTESSISNDVNVTIIHKINFDDNQQKFCSFWNGLQWEMFSESENSSNFLICTHPYESLTFWAITSKIEVSENFTEHTTVKAPENFTEHRTVTEDLVSVLESNKTTPVLVERLVCISTRYEEFKSIDVYLLGKNLQKISESEEVNLNSLMLIVNNVQKIERSVLFESQQKTSATDLILRYIDVIIQNHRYTQYVEEVGEHFMLLVSDARSNFSGIGILANNGTHQTEILESISDLTKYLELGCALVLTSELKNQMDNDSKIIITVYFQDVLFQENVTAPRNVSTIFGVILPDVGVYESPVSVFHNLGKAKNKECAYWSYSSDANGFWKPDHDSKDGKDSLVQCDYWHTTHLALLILDEDKYEDKNDFLSIITSVCYLISSLGLCGVLVTAALFKIWRKDTGNQILLNFVFVDLIQLIGFYISTNVYYHSDSRYLCIITGVILHYCLISEFCWMFIIAVLQCRRFVTDIFGTRRRNLLVKALLAGWVPPFIPVLSVVLADPESYERAQVGLCYPSGLSLFLGVWLPIIIILIANCVIYIIIMFNVISKKTRPVCGEDSKYQRRLGIFLFSMLGLTWTFGFLAKLSFGVVFAYLFVLTATLQGFVIFLFFIVFNANSRHMYVSAIRNFCNR